MVRIERLSVENYRSCLNTEITLQPDLTVLIGPNGAGKTCLLNAFGLLRQITELTKRRTYQRVDPFFTDESKLKAWMSLGAQQAILTSQLALYFDDDNTDVVVASRDSWYAKDFTDSATRIEIPLEAAHAKLNPDAAMYTYWHYHRGSDITIPQSFRDPLLAFITYFSNIKYYGTSQFTNPSRCPVSFQVEEGPAYLRNPSSSHEKFLSDLFAAYKDSRTSNYNEYFNIIGPNGIGLIDRLDFKEVKTSSTEALVRSGGNVQQRKREKRLIIPQFHIGKSILSPSQLSEGTYKTITLLFYLIMEESSALLIEEPEVCVHHGLLSSIVELIKEYSAKRQIVISTHSDFILDSVEPRNVYAVRRDKKTGTEVKQLEKGMSSSELASLRHYLENDGNLGEYWRHGGLE